MTVHLKVNGHKLTLKEASLKPTVSKWAALHRGFEDPRRFKEGLDFVVATQSFIGGSKNKKWEGCSVLLYERKTQSLFQYIADNRTLEMEEKENRKQEADGAPLKGQEINLRNQMGKLILYAASKAYKKLEAEKKLGKWEDKKISLAISAPFAKRNRTNHIYTAVRTLLNTSSKGKQIKFYTPLVSRNGKAFDFSRWELDWYIGRFNSKHEIKHEKVNDLKNEINNLSKQVTKYFKQQDRKKGLDLNPKAEKIIPSWSLLSPPRSVK